MLPEYLTKREIGLFEISKDAINIYPNAVDLINTSSGRSVRHEDTCFDYLRKQAQDNVLVGPHLIDYMFGKTPYVAGIVRPDALLLNSQGTTLTGMAEFKSGKGNGFTNKLEGFSILLRKLRTQPHTLPEMMFYSIGEHVETPSEIIIPPDEEIEITFLAPFEQGVLFDASTFPFPVTYFRVPLKEAPAA